MGDSKRQLRSETGFSAFLDQGASFEGMLNFQGVVRIDGTFHGAITSDDTLQIGPTGKVTGTINVGEAIIGGYFKGTVVAQQRVEFKATAVMHGDVLTPNLKTEEGAQLQAQIKMTKAEITAPTNNSSKK